MSNPSIIGAGLSGLIAAQIFQKSEVFESQPEPQAMHRAVLRFRSDAIAKLTGIDFAAVTVRKGIWMDGAFVAPTIQIANMYSKKVIGHYESERSIWNLEAATRFIAPENFYEQLVELAGARVAWNVNYSFSAPREEPLISTVPLPVLLAGITMVGPQLKLVRAPIVVKRYRIPQCNLYQTIYFPSLTENVYRASITKDLLIVELRQDGFVNLPMIMESFGLDDFDPLDSSKQQYGKIIPLDGETRRGLLHRLTMEHQIYSLGRFATWRNILLDDVVQDASAIRRLLMMSSYGKSLHLSHTP
jgi:hypothetical protein